MPDVRRALLPGAGWRIERRPVPGNPAIYRAGSVLAGVAAAALAALLLSGSSAGGFFSDLWNLTLGSTVGIHGLALLATPLILTGVAVAVPLRLGLWNVGADGQLFLGAWAAFAVGELFPSAPAALLLPLMIVAGALAGGVWSFIPALARVHLGVNEIIGTLLMNFVAINWVLYWAGEKWAETATAGGVRSTEVAETAQLANFQLGSLFLPMGFLIAVAVAVLVWLGLRYSKLGYETSIVGSSPRAASYAGMHTKRVILTAFVIGGGVAGIAGVIELVGNVHRFGPALSNNAGYTGIVVAVLAGASALGVVGMGIVFAAITTSSSILRVGGSSSDLIFALFGLTLVIAAVGQGLAHLRVVRSRSPARTESRPPPQPSIESSSP